MLSCCYGYAFSPNGGNLHLRRDVCGDDYGSCFNFEVQFDCIEDEKKHCGEAVATHHKLTIGFEESKSASLNKVMIARKKKKHILSGNYQEISVFLVCFCCEIASLLNRTDPPPPS